MRAWCMRATPRRPQYMRANGNTQRLQCLGAWRCGACCDMQEDGQAMAVGEHAPTHARCLAATSCGCRAAIAAGKARRLEQAAQRPISWLALHSMAQAVACSLGGRSTGGEEAAAEANAKDGGSTHRGRTSPLCWRQPVQRRGSGALAWRQRTRGAERSWVVGARVRALWRLP